MPNDEQQREPYREYTNLSIRLRDFDGQRFAVEVTDSPVGRMRDPDYVMFDWGVLPLLQKHDELNDEKQEDLSLRDLRELGEMLGGMLFPPTVREAFRKSMVWVIRKKKLYSPPEEEPSLRIILDIDDTRLMSLPWEYTYMWEYGQLARGTLGTSEQVKATLSAPLADKDKQDKIEGLREKSQLDGFLIRDPRISMVRLEPWEYDTFRTRGEQASTLVTFVPNGTGGVSGVRISGVVFARQRTR